jgi:phosphate transport system substrate-binding protein
MKTLRWLVCLIAAWGTVATVEGQKVSVKGSNTFGEKLGPALSEAFSRKNPAIAVQIESKGSGSGIAALLDGACDIASSSRVLTEDEVRLAKSRNIRLDNHVVGYYGIAVVVQANHPVKALTDKQVEQIFTGAITNWKQVGGPDLAIVPYIPKPTDGTYLGFQELAMAKKPYAATAVAKDHYHEIAEAVANDPGGIGYVSLNVMKETGLHGMLINGMHPSTIAVIEGLYPYARMVRLMTNHEKTSREARRFIRFIQSKEGQKIVEKTGFVPRYASPIDYGGIGM